MGNKFVCSICDKKLYTRVHLDRHYELVHNMVQCKKCGELIESNVVSIRIHNRKCIIGFKVRRFDSDDFQIRTISA